MYTTDEIAALAGARAHGGRGGRVSWLLTDSRSLSFPEETLFFALRTQRGDGHAYIPELYGRGVRSFVVEELPSGHAARFPGACFLEVPSALGALQRLAARHRERFSIPVVGITGSNGKTVVKEWLHQLLSPGATVTRSPRSYNSQVGVPLSVWLLSGRTDIGVFEAGISRPGEMAALGAIIQPTVCVLTNLGATHQENFPSMEAKCMEKLLLARGAGMVVYPHDDVLVRRCVEASGLAGAGLSWSMGSGEAALRVLGVERAGGLSRVRIEHGGRSGEYVLPFVDGAAVANSVTCAAVALGLGLDMETIAQRMRTLEPVAMRLEVKEGVRGCTLINDSYNSDVKSLDIALDFMNRRQDRKGRRHTLILSDMHQTGLPPGRLYGEVSDLVSMRGVDRLIGIGPDMCAQGDAFRVADRHFFPSCADFVSSGVFRALENEVVLLKGARGFHFDRLVELLEQKVHETILEVNLGALVKNLDHFRSLLRPGTRIACMVKADAYGAGAVEVARTLQDHRVDYLAVAVADEGAALRRAGITCSIMVMNPEMGSFKAIFDNRLEPEVYSFRILDALVRAASREGITGYPVHVKLDTGMHRLGFDPEGDMDELVRRLKGQGAVVPRSVFSHFAGSDNEGLDGFSDLQFSRFARASDRLQAAFPHRILRHMDNTAGISRFPDFQLDMCRLGIGLYGVNNRDNTMINTVSTLRTTILQMRRVGRDETVGYGRRGVLSRDSVIGAIPIGYADGLDRGLGCGRCFCLVNGRRAPYVGNICMDVAMIDLTGIDCREGDPVEIFGEGLPVTVLSDAIGTIPYEVLTGVSNRVKRVYFQD